MTPFAQSRISESDLSLFNRIKKAVEKMGDPDLGLDQDGKPVVLSCHMLARAAAKVFSVCVVDGFFAEHYEHSWVLSPDGHLIDLYPVAVIGGPIMYDGEMLSPQRLIYTPCSAKKMSRNRFGKNSFRRSVRRIARALEQACQ